MKVIEDALKYTNFVFIDCTKYRNKTSGQFKGSFVKINGQVYQLKGQGSILFFEFCTEEDLAKEKIVEKQVKFEISPGEHIGVIIYDNHHNTNYEYVVPTIINKRILLH